MVFLNEELFKKIPLPINDYEDNQFAMRNCTPHVSKNRLRQVEKKQFKSADYVEKGYIKINYIPTAEQIADLLTKPLPENTFTKLRDQLV